MRKLIALGLLLILSACGSTKYTSDGYVRTLYAPSSYIPKTAVACIKSQLLPVYPSTAITMQTANIYTGHIPGTERDRPLAKIIVEEMSGENPLARITLYQIQPVDPSLTDLVKKCF